MKKKLIVGLLGALLIAPPTLFLGIAMHNRQSWRNAPAEKNPWELRQTSAAGIEAGRKYLQTVMGKPSDEEFLATMEKLVHVPQWDFINDDAALYRRNGAMNCQDAKTPLWTIPLGNAKDKVNNLLVLAEEDVKSGNLTKAQNTVLVVVEMGNHLQDFPQLIPALIGGAFLDCAIQFLHAHPDANSEEIHGALARSRGQAARFKSYLKFENDLLILTVIQRAGKDVDAGWQDTRYLVSYPWMKQSAQRWAECIDKEADVAQWLRESNRRDYIHGQIGSVIIHGIGTPAVDLSPFKRRDQEIQKLLDV